MTPVGGRQCSCDCSRQLQRVDKFLHLCGLKMAGGSVLDLRAFVHTHVRMFVHTHKACLHHGRRTGRLCADLPSASLSHKACSSYSNASSRDLLREAADHRESCCRSSNQLSLALYYSRLLLLLHVRSDTDTLLRVFYSGRRHCHIIPCLLAAMPIARHRHPPLSAQHPNKDLNTSPRRKPHERSHPHQRHRSIVRPASCSSSHTRSLPAPC